MRSGERWGVRQQHQARRNRNGNESETSWFLVSLFISSSINPATMRISAPLTLLLLQASSAFVPRNVPSSGAAGRISSHATTLAAAKKSAASKNKDDGSSSSSEDPARRAALDGVLSQIERNYGRGSVVRLGDDPASLRIDTISSGALTLDAALGGGYPKGRVVEIYGPESSGKTTLALHAIAECQAAGGIAAFVDAEHALDPTYAAGLGVDTDALYVSQPDSGEMALDIVDRLVRSSAVDVIVVDSVAALVPRAELEGDMSDQQIGLQARLMSKAMRKIVGSLALSQCSIIFLNQLRSKVGVIYGSPEVTAGGNALKFYSSIRIDTRRRDVLPDNVGIRIRAKVVKNKIAPPFKEAMLDIMFGTGIDRLGCLLDAAVESDIVVRKGSWYSYDNTNFAQGRFNAAEYLKEDADLARRIENDVRAAMSLASIAGAAEEGEGGGDEEGEILMESKEVKPVAVSDTDGAYE